MNLMINATSTPQIDNNKLRRLSHSEQIEVNGGGECYKYPKGSGKNDSRWVTDGFKGTVYQKWNGSRYVGTGIYGNYANNFGFFCKSRGYNYFY